MSARLLLSALVLVVVAPTAVPTAVPNATDSSSEDTPASSDLGTTKATTYKWMWGDAGEDLLGHTVAEANPFRWSLWADAADTIKNLEQYKKHDDQYRPVQMEVGPPPLKTHHFSNIAAAVEYLNSYVAPGNVDHSEEVEPSYPEEAAVTSYPPGTFLELGGKIQTKVAAGTTRDLRKAANPPGQRIHLADVAEFLFLVSFGFVLLVVLVAALRRRRPAVPGRASDEEAPLNEVLPWIEQGSMTASESDVEGQFLRLPLRLEQDLRQE